MSEARDEIDSLDIQLHAMVRQLRWILNSKLVLRSDGPRHGPAPVHTGHAVAEVPDWRLRTWLYTAEAALRHHGQGSAPSSTHPTAASTQSEAGK